MYAQRAIPRILYSLPATRRGLRTYLVYPAAVCLQPYVLARGDDCSAPRTHLADGMRLVVFRIEVLQLPILAVALLHLPLGRVLAVLRQDTLRLLPQAFGLLPDELFVAVLGNHSYRALLRVRDCTAIPATPV
jgi:hypothetical protein